MLKLIAYLRVSTRQQGHSGLGLKAQRRTVQAFADRTGGEVIKWYVEVESGSKSNRPKIRKALRRCRMTGATLVVAKIDRLSRNLKFVTTLQESHLPFVCCDMPEADETTIHILVALAQKELKWGSIRTREGLAETKAAGTLLGAANPRIAVALEGRRGFRKAGRLSAKQRHRRAIKHYRNFIPLVRHLRPQTPWRQVADTFNASGYLTKDGMPWTKTTAHRTFGPLEKARPVDEHAVCATL